MAPDDFAAEVKRAQGLSNALKKQAKLILRKALPQIEPLQQDNTHFSPRMMLLMVSRAEATMPAADRTTLRSVLLYIGEFDHPLFQWLVALKNGTDTLDIAAETTKCREAIKQLERCRDELDTLRG